MQADADAQREMTKRLEAKLSSTRALVVPGGGDHNTAALAERVQRLTARLQGEHEQVRHQKHENARLQDECSVMREALEARGEMGALQRALVQARADSMRLALQLHDAKEGARSALEEGATKAAEAAAAEAKAEGLREVLGEQSERADKLQAALAWVGLRPTREPEPGPEPTSWLGERPGVYPRSYPCPNPTLSPG